MRNGSGELPTQDYVLVLNETEYHEFNLGILNITTQSQTKAIFKKDLMQSDRWVTSQMVQTPSRFDYVLILHMQIFLIKWL